MSQGGMPSSSMMTMMMLNNLGAGGGGQQQQQQQQPLQGSGGVGIIGADAIMNRWASHRHSRRYGQREELFWDAARWYRR